ncbi:MAG: IS4 family transposase [bacterium]|nr:IS4 family transposase [bacterium]
MNINEIIIRMIKEVNKISDKRNYNKYIKNHSIEKMFMLLIYQQFSGIDCGRAFTIYLNSLLGDTTETISQSELSKKLSYKLPVELFKEIYEMLLWQSKKHKSKELNKIERMIRIIDSTALPATSSMKYAKHRQNKNGFKMHTVIDDNYFPESIYLKNGRSSDKKSLKWAIKEGYIHLFDRGYNDYSQFKWITEKKNAFFVTRALNNITFSTVKNKKVGFKQREYGILSDKIIEVIIDRSTGETFTMRMVTFKFIDSRGMEQEFSLLTNLINVRSDEIAMLYRERWNIEVVFRWIKTFLKIDHWISRSKNGVLIQIYSALCAYMMALLAKMGNAKKFYIMKDCIYLFMKEFKNIFQLFEKNSNIEEFFLKSS